MLEKCRETVKAADKYITDQRAHNFIRENRLCPPPKGHWTMTFSKLFTTEDLPKSFFGPLQSVRFRKKLFVVATLQFYYLRIFYRLFDSFIKDL